MSSEASAEAGRWITARAEYQRGMMDAVNDPSVHTVVIMSSAQIGKALCLNTPIATPAGWSTMGDLSVGDQVYGADGKPCTVTFATETMYQRPCYNVEFSDGSVIVADEEHKWSTNRGVVTTGEMVKDYKNGKRNKYWIPVTKPLTCDDMELPIDPYWLGVWLGDGNSACTQITFHKDDQQIIDEMPYRSVVRQIDKRRPDTMNAYFHPRRLEYQKECRRGHIFDDTGLNSQGYCAECHRIRSRGGVLPPVKPDLQDLLNQNNLIGNKHIPAQYLRTGYDQRLSLLQGLMDSDGSVTKNGRCEFSTTSGPIAKGFGELLSSLGIKFTQVTKQPVTTYKTKRVFGKLTQRFSFMVYSDVPVFRLKRKLNRLVDRTGRRTTEVENRRIVKIESVQSIPVRCIQVDSEDHLFLAGKTMIPTHNTEALNNIIGYFIDYQPSPILVLQPTLEMAKAWSTDRLAPMIRDTKTLKGKFAHNGKAKAADTLFHKQFIGGHITMAGANSPASLASRPIRIVLADEVDRYPLTAGAEGDPISLARKRTTTFWNRKLILTSTPTDENSRILRSYNQSDQRQYFVPCPHCGTMQTLKWSNVIIPKDEHEQYKLDDTFYTCEQGCVIDMNEKPKMVAKGEWRITEHNPKSRGVAGFHLNELYSPWVKWSETAESFLEQKGDPETLKTWVNTSLGEVFRHKGDKANVTVESLMARRENYDKDTLPDDILFITCAADVQKNRVELLVQGWGAKKERWNIEQPVVWGDPVKDDEVWEKVDELLMTKYQVRGQAMPIACSVIDSGGMEGTSDRVYNFTKPRNGRRVFAIKGSTEYYPPAASRPKQVGRVRAMLYMIGGDTIKDWLFFTYLKEPDKIHFPNWCDDEFFKQLLGEERKTTMFRGNSRFKWSKTRERQEVLDLHVYNEGAYAILNPDIEALQAKITGKVVEPEEPEEPRRSTQPPVRKPRRKRKKNWVTNI